MQFKKYSEIENSYRQKYIDYIYEQGLNGGDDWIVSEKIHGSCTQFACNGNDVFFGKRTSFLSDNSNFFNWKTVYDKYHNEVLKIYKALKHKIITLEQITVFGELYGGIYPHDDIKPVPNASKVQKGVYYCPHNDFMVFDIYVYFINNEKITGIWLAYNDVRDLCQTYGLMCLEPLFSGTLEECLKYQNDFQSTIYKYHMLPKIENNICEGVVIKPTESKHFSNGERVIIKNKNEKWVEKKNEKKIKQVTKASSKEVLQHVNKMKLLVTENRLKNLLSKFGPVGQKDFGKLMSGMMSDIMNEYLKDERQSYNILGKLEQKQISKLITKEIAELIRPNFVNIIDSTY